MRYERSTSHYIYKCSRALRAGILVWVDFYSEALAAPKIEPRASMTMIPWAHEYHETCMTASISQPLSPDWEHAWIVFTWAVCRVSGPDGPILSVQLDNRFLCITTRVQIICPLASEPIIQLGTSRDAAMYYWLHAVHACVNQSLFLWTSR